MSLYVHDHIVFNRGKNEGIELGRIENKIELVMKNRDKLEEESAADFFECDKTIVDEIYCIMDTQPEIRDVKQLYQILVEREII